MSRSDTNATASTSEAAVLIACARLGRPVRESVAAAEPDWSKLKRMAVRNGMAPLLCTRLAAECPDLVPPEAMAQMRTDLARTTAANLARTQELVGVMAALEAAGIPPFAYKGPTLAQQAYGNVALRPFVDLDIFVRRADVDAASRVLEERGYERPHDFTPAQAAAFARTEYQLTFLRPQNGQVVELHWDFAWPHFTVELDVDRYWDRLSSCAIGGRSIPCLAPADLVTALCVHGAKHCWERLEWAASLARIVDTHREIDWADLLADAARRGIRRIVLLGLRLAGDLLPDPLPSAVTDAIDADPTLVRLSAEAAARQMSSVAPPLDLQKILSDAAYQMRCRERRTDRLRFLVRFGADPTAEDIEQVRLPHRFSFAYQLIRPFRLAIKYARLS